MLFDVYAIRDLEKGEFAQPFFVPEGTNVESVKINFKRLIEKGDSEVSYFPERFELWIIGVFFSDATPNHYELVFDNAFTPKVICKGSDYARPEYLAALAKAKKEMEDNEEKAD